MLVGMYVIYDELAKKSAPVFMAESDALALRQFESMKGIPEVVKRDLRVYRVGRIDTTTMQIEDGYPCIVDAASILAVED